MQGILDLYRLAYPDWQFKLGHAPSHRLENYDVTHFNSSTLAYIQAHAKDDFLFSFIEKKLAEANIQNSVVAIDFFWPGELYQIMFVAKYLKEHGNNTIVLDASAGDEQVDYTQWSKVFLAHPELFTYFDAYIVYQDYNKTRSLLLDHLSNAKPLDELSPDNVVYRDKSGELTFKKPTRMDEDELFDVFCNLYHQPARLRWRASIGYYMGMRLFPYKCYWSGCHFCTINSSYLFPYMKENTHRYIDATLDFFESQQGRVDHLFFQDEALHPSDMEYFAHEVIRRKIRLSFSVRARFESAYTPEFCKLMHDAGMHFCGIGLESATDAINASVNKGQEPNIREKLQIIKNFVDAGIAFHNYAILGFPHETSEEVMRTFLFLKNCMRSISNYGATPNTFGLNK